MNRRSRFEPESILVGDRQAQVIAHLVREHRWDEWDLTEYYAVHNLHTELHEQVHCDHRLSQFMKPVVISGDGMGSDT